LNDASAHHDLLLSLSFDGDDWPLDGPLELSWSIAPGAGAAALDGAEDDDAESDERAGDEDEGDAGAAELVGGGSDDVLWRSPQAPSSKAAVMAIDSVDSLIAFPFMNMHRRTINAARFAPVARPP
jgi:hypothetical protein